MYNIKVLVLSLLIVAPFFLGVNVFQTATLKKDGSGTINLQYNAKASDVKKNKSIIWNFPFQENLAKEYFTSSNTTVKNAKLNYNAKDSIYFMTVDVEFNDIDLISEAKGFSNIKPSMTNSDSGIVFNYTLVKNLNQFPNIGNFSYIFNFENDVQSSNGVVKANTVTWGGRNTKNTDFTKDVVLTATLKGEVKKQPTVPGNKQTSGDKESEKGCGLFGIELPIIFLSGMLISGIYRNRKKNN